MDDDHAFDDVEDDGLKFSYLETRSSSDEEDEGGYDRVHGDHDDDDLDHESDDDGDGDEKVLKGKKVATGLKHINQIKDILGLEAFKEKSASRKEKRRRAKIRKKLRNSRVATKEGPDVGPGAVKTLASSIRSSSAPELVVFKDPRKTKKLVDGGQRLSVPSLQSRRTHEPEKDDDIVTMKRARFDVFKFGVSGMDKAAKQNAEVAQLVRLGAKTPRKPCLPYATLKVMRKKQREEEKKQREMKRLSAMRFSTGGQGKGTKKTKRKKSDSVQANMGKFDGGMLKLNADEVAKIRKRR